MLSCYHRAPRAGLDPITDAPTALAAITLAAHHPPQPETIVLFLDDARCGITLAVVTGTERPNDVLDVAETFIEAATDSPSHAIVLATVRPGGGSDASDIDRWLEMSQLADDAGLELVEWFVIGRDLTCPRDRLGEPPRW